MQSIENNFFTESDEYQYELVSASTSEANTNRQFFNIKKSEIPKADEIFDNVINDNLPALPHGVELENIWAYIYKVQCHNTTIYLFRKNNSLLLMRKDRSYPLFFSNNKLNLFDKDILRLSSKIDVILIGDELIILDRSEFERTFDYVEAMQTSAKENVDFINRANLIEGIDKIDNLKKNKATLKKLLNIKRDSPVLLRTPSQIVTLAKKYKLKLEMNDDNSRLLITSKKSAIAFVEMLNDDYLKSEFSGSKYKTKGKAQI
jgi:hypothetical protein